MNDKACVTDARILSHIRLEEGIYDLRLHCPEIVEKARPGQFVMVNLKDGAHLLGRPISICDYDKDEGSLRLVYRVAGEGTRLLKEMISGEYLRVHGPLGNGFPLELGDDARKVCLIGGGIGIPPMVALGKAYRVMGLEVTHVAGYRDEHLFLDTDLKKSGQLLVATEDGSVGAKGTVIDALSQGGVEPDIICACGPMPMLRAVYEWAKQRNVPCYVSLEERMACGIGACLGCVCKTKDVDAHTHVQNARVCKDGPVFLGERVFE